MDERAAAAARVALPELAEAVWIEPCAVGEGGEERCFVFGVGDDCAVGALAVVPGGRVSEGAVGGEAIALRVRSGDRPLRVVGPSPAGFRVV